MPKFRKKTLRQQQITSIRKVCKLKIEVKGTECPCSCEKGQNMNSNSKA